MLAWLLLASEFWAISGKFGLIMGQSEAFVQFSNELCPFLFSPFQVVGKFSVQFRKFLF